MKLNKDFILVRVANEWVAAPANEVGGCVKGVFILNETGAFLFRCLQRGESRQSIIEGLQTEFAVETDEAEQDLQEYLDVLSQAGLLDE